MSPRQVGVIAKKARAKQLLQTASGAAKALEESVRELVEMRAWELLGYENFSVMWEKECGFPCPTYAKVIASVTLDEGGNTNRGNPNGLTTAEIARAVGFPVKRRPHSGYEASSTVTAVRRQVRLGVPLREVRLGTGADNAGSATRMVTIAVIVPGQDAVLVAEIAKDANISKATIYRQAVAEYLERHRKKVERAEARKARRA